MDYYKKNEINIPKDELARINKSPEFIDSLAKTITGFPYKKYFIKDVKIRFNKIKNYKPNITHNKFYILPKSEKYKTNIFDLTSLNGQYISFKSKPEDYDLDVITDVFTEQQRLSACRNSESLSILERWKTVNFRKKIITTAIKTGELNSYTLRESVYKVAKECTQFKITLAISVMQYFKAEYILDFSAGWGDRLIAAIAYNPSRYLGFDPNKALEAGHTAIKKKFCTPKNINNFEIIYEPFEKTNMNIENQFDLVFTSPPFFNFEKYSDLPGQSIDNYPTRDQWLVKFLFASIKKAWVSLIIGGYMVLYISDTYNLKITEPMNLMIATLNDSEYKGVIAAQGGVSGQARPFFVWQRIRKNNGQAHLETIDSQKAKELLHRYFPNI